MTAAPLVSRLFMYIAAAAVVAGMAMPHRAHATGYERASITGEAGVLPLEMHRTSNIGGGQA